VEVVQIPKASRARDINPAEKQYGARS